MYLCWLYVYNISLQARAKSTASDLTSSHNVTYDSVGNTARMSTQANIACLENVAYAPATDTEKKMTNTSTSHTATYEEVQHWYNNPFYVFEQVTSMHDNLS